MNSKIKNYVEALFSDIPHSKRANDLKEEILSNMSERFDDYVKAGETENQAYTHVVSSLGDIDEMLAGVIPKEDLDYMDDKHSRLLKNILTIYWIIMAFTYLVISFTTGLWLLTWLIFVIATVPYFFIKILLEREYGIEK